MLIMSGACMSLSESCEHEPFVLWPRRICPVLVKSPSITNPNSYGNPENYNSLCLCKVVKKMEFIVT